MRLTHSYRKSNRIETDRHQAIVVCRYGVILKIYLPTEISIPISYQGVWHNSQKDITGSASAQGTYHSRQGSVVESQTAS